MASRPRPFRPGRRPARQGPWRRTGRRQCQRPSDLRHLQEGQTDRRSGRSRHRRQPQRCPSMGGDLTYKLTSGQMPTTDGEIVPTCARRKPDRMPGDTVRIVTAGARAQVQPKLVGIIEPSGLLIGASIVIWTTHEAQALYQRARTSSTTWGHRGGRHVTDAASRRRRQGSPGRSGGQDRPRRGSEAANPSRRA